MLLSKPAKKPRSKTFVKLEELVKCAVCHELLNNPKVFPCLHSYCYECIVKLSERECGLECPECRAPVEIGNPPDLSVLPTNFFVNNVLATLSLGDNDDAPALLCDNCEEPEEPVEKRCKDCLQFLCGPFAEFHRISCDTKNHVLQSKDELKNNEPAENARPLKCNEHHELIKYYCDTCQKTICMSCTVLEHKPHNVVALEKSTLDAKDEVENLLKKVNERVETISAEIDVAVAQSQDITVREEACKSQIEAFFTQLQEKIDAEKQKMLAKTASAAEYRKNQVEAPKKVLDLALSMCQNGVNFAKHSLENGNDVQLLNIKPTITQYLVNLKTMGDEVIPKVENPIQFLKSESSIELCIRLIRDICSVEEVAVCPEKCEAKFLDPTVKVGKRSVIVVTCKDKDGWIITSGCEKDLIQPTFTGVQVEDIEISENRNGTHEISFVVNELGTLQFEAKIKGVAAPSCSLEAVVKWELSAVHGSGYLRMNGQMVMINCLSGEGDVGKYCFRLGDTPMTSGAHHWKVEVSHALEGAEECFHDAEGPTFGVGVVEAGDDYSEASIVHEVTKNWIYSGQAEKITNVVLNLDMGKQSLEILPGRKGLVATSKFSFLRKVFHVNADVVFPFFAVNCPHCSLVVHFGK